MLRLYTSGREINEGIVDISPRLGRAVMFKSEEMLHQVMSSEGWDNYALTIYFTQVVDKPPKPHPIPDDWKMFISIASYRDHELSETILALVAKAAYHERLRIVVFNQIDLMDEWDRKQDNVLHEVIYNITTKLRNPPSILVENIWHEKAINVYYAR